MGAREGWTPPTPREKLAQQVAEENAKRRQQGEAPAPSQQLQPRPPAQIGVPQPTLPEVADGGTEVDELTPAHMQEIARREEGFGGGDLTTRDGPTGNRPMPSSPAEAAQIIEQLTNEKIRLQTERDAACAEVDAYYKAFGPLPEGD